MKSRIIETLRTTSLRFFSTSLLIVSEGCFNVGNPARKQRLFSDGEEDVYDEFENESFLCKRFSVFSIKYDLMSIENLIVPIAGMDFNDIKKVNSIPVTMCETALVMENPVVVTTVPPTVATNSDGIIATTVLRSSSDSSEA